MGAKNKKFILIAAGVISICIIGIMLLISDSGKDTPKQPTHSKGTAYQSKVVPIAKTRQTAAKPELAVAAPKKSTENPAPSAKEKPQYQKPLIAKQLPETAPTPNKTVAQRPGAIKPVTTITASQKQAPTVVHIIKPAVIPALAKPKQQPVKKAVTALKLEEATSITPRKKHLPATPTATTNKITALKLKKSTVVESMHSAWVIQLGSFGDATNATNLRDKLKKAGFTSFVEAAQINNKKITRVYVGPEAALRDAKKILEKLKKEQNMKGIIVGYNG